MSFKPAAISLLIVVTGFSLRAQQPDMLSVLQERLVSHQLAHPSGNLYLHLDKTTYAPEETLWFKAYLLGDKSMEAQVLYVRIVNRERTVVAQGQFPVYDIRSHGSLDLSSPDRSRVIGHRYIYDPPWEPFEGDYTLYAYTDHMVAVNDTNVFVQPISIRRRGGRALEAEAAVADTTRLERGGDVRVKATVRYGGSPLEGARGEYRLLSGRKELGHGRLRTDVLGNALVDFTYPEIVPDSGSLRLEFLFRHGDATAELSLALPHRNNPLFVDCRGEGGVLVAGGRASVEVLDIHDHPVSTEVLVMDGDATVDSLHTDGQGIAIWDIPPAQGRRYTLIADAGRCRLPVDVPAAAGYTLRLTAGPTGQRAMVHNHGVVGSAMLVIRSPDEVVWSRAQAITAGHSAAVDIPTGVLPAGVWSLAVFDEEGRLHAERLFGDTGSGSHRLYIDVDRREYGRKQQVTVRMRATDVAGNPVVANLSVSATEKARVDSTVFPGIVEGFYYKDFQQEVRRRLSGIGSDGLLMGLSWPGNGWEDVLSRTAALPHVPGTDGATGLVVGMRYEPNAEHYEGFVPVKRNIREVRLRATRGRFIDSGFEPAVEWMTVRVDPETGTFFIPDSLLLSRKGQEWLLEIPRGNPPWRYEYLVDWRNPDIAFDSTIVRGDQLYRLAVLSNFANSAPPGPPATDFGGMNLLEEVVVGSKQQPIRRTLRKTDCQLYEEMLYKMQYRTSGGSRKSWILVKGQTHPWGWYPYGGARIVMYLGCGRYRDIGYIRNITIPEEFPLPDYDTNPTAVLDMRSTVYWNPNVYTDADGTATFSFFTSDVTGEFEIVAQGLVESDLRPLMGTGNFNVTMKQ